MATYEKNGRLTYKDTDGNLFRLYPLIQKSCIEGIDESDLDKLHDVIVSAAELNSTSGISSNIQSQLNNKASSSHIHSTTMVDNPDTITENGFYCMFGKPGNPSSGFWVGFHLNSCVLENRITRSYQYFYNSDLKSIVVRYWHVDSGWSEWEWENPPMYTSEEYRTTERTCGGKPVYTKTIQVKPFPATGNLDIILDDVNEDWTVNYRMDTSPFRHEVYCYEKQEGKNGPWAGRRVPLSGGYFVNTEGYNCFGIEQPKNVGEATDYKVFFRMWYTK